MPLSAGKRDLITGVHSSAELQEPIIVVVVVVSIIDGGEEIVAAEFDGNTVEGIEVDVASVLGAFEEANVGASVLLVPKPPMGVKLFVGARVGVAGTVGESVLVSTPSMRDVD